MAKLNILTVAALGGLAYLLLKKKRPVVPEIPISPEPLEKIERAVVEPETGEKVTVVTERTKDPITGIVTEKTGIKKAETPFQTRARRRALTKREREGFFKRIFSLRRESPREFRV